MFLPCMTPLSQPRYQQTLQRMALVLSYYSRIPLSSGDQLHMHQDPETWYAQIEKEALATTWACERFSDYILGKQITIETHHKPLVPLLSTKHLDAVLPRVLRFRLWLMRFDFWAAFWRPYIVFTFTRSVRSIWNDVYIYMSTTWRTRSQYVIFWLYFGKIHSFDSDFISEESFRPEEFFEVLF